VPARSVEREEERPGRFDRAVSGENAAEVKRCWESGSVFDPSCGGGRSTHGGHRAKEHGWVVISFITPMRRFVPETVERMRAMLPTGYEFIVVTAPGGAAHAKNIGAAAAKGEVLVFVDDDVHLVADWAWDDWLRRDWQFAIAELYWPAPAINTFMMRTEATLLNVLTSVFRYKMFMTGFAAVRRPAFEEVGGYNESVVFEEHGITLDFYRRRFRGARLPVRVQVLRRWHGWSPSNDATSRGKEHPPPKPEEVTVLRT